MESRLSCLSAMLVCVSVASIARAESKDSAKPVDLFRLANGFVREDNVRGQSPRLPAFSTPNRWGVDTAYLVATNAKGQRTWRIENFLPQKDSSQGSTMYLLEGARLGLLVDTAQNTQDELGKNDLKTLVKYLLAHHDDGSDKTSPVDFVVCNTHNHGDHTGKNALMSDRTLYYPEQDYRTDRAEPSNYVPIREGGGDGPHGRAVGSIDLGGRLIEATDIAEHTAGSTAYLDRENQMLATGDGIGSAFVWAQLGFIAQYDSSVHHLQQVVKPYDHLTVLPAHFYQNATAGRDKPPINGRPIDKSYIDDTVDTADGILNGTVLSVPYGLGRDTVEASVRSAAIVYMLSRISAAGKDKAYHAVELTDASITPEDVLKAHPFLGTGAAKAYMIHDGTDSLYLVVGSSKALLIGPGSGRPGLPALVSRLAGSVPVEVLVTNAGAEQTTSLAQFGGRIVYVPKGADIPHGGLKHVVQVGDGDVITLGKRGGKTQSLLVLSLPGHSRSELTLLVAGDQLLFAGDALGTQGSGSNMSVPTPGIRRREPAQSNAGGLMLTLSLANSKLI